MRDGGSYVVACVDDRGRNKGNIFQQANIKIAKVAIIGSRHKAPDGLGLWVSLVRILIFNFIYYLFPQISLDHRCTLM